MAVKGEAFWDIYRLLKRPDCVILRLLIPALGDLEFEFEVDNG